MVILPILCSLLYYKNILTRGLILGVALILFALIFVSGGIGALLALLAGLWVVCLTNRRFLVWAGLGFLLCCIGMFTFLVTPGALEAYLIENWYTRLELWKTAEAMIRDYPVTGVGLGVESWFRFLPQYATPDLHFQLGNPASLWIIHSHNFYLQTWVEQGFLGFITLITIITVGMWMGVHSLMRVKGEQQSIVFGAFWSFAAWSIHCLVYSCPSTQGIIGLWVTLGIMVAAGQANTRLKPRYRNSTQKQGEIFLSYLRQLSSSDIGRFFQWVFLYILLILLSMLSALWVRSNFIGGICTGVLAGFILAVRIIDHYQVSTILLKRYDHRVILD